MIGQTRLASWSEIRSIARAMAPVNRDVCFMEEGRVLSARQAMDQRNVGGSDKTVYAVRWHR